MALRYVFAFLMAVTAMVSQTALAAVTVCVSTSQQLTNALNAWVASSGDTYEIHLVQGSYTLTGNLGFDQFNAGNNSNLRWRGGYTANCAGRQLLASNTIIDGLNAANNGLELTANSNALIEGLTFQGFTRAVYLFDVAGSTSYVLDVRYIVARNMSNAAGSSEGSIAIVGSTQIRFRDSLIYDVAASPTGAAAELRTIGDTGVASIVNVTIANNSGTGLLLYNVGASSMIAQDDIIWGNSGASINVGFCCGAQAPSIDHSDYQSVTGPLTIGAGNISADPHFVSAAGADFRLQSNSPAINVGAASVSAGYPSLDLAAQARFVGSHVDFGAYESTVDDLNNFSVTTTFDNGNNASPTPGSLRAAIKGSNASPAASKVTFAVPGSCPHTFTLAGALPNITTDVTIDGTSQPGWVANSSFGQFDATLCAFFNGNGSSPYALHVPTSAGSSARLVVKGLVFVGFTDAAIKIEGGANHLISGNQFGAIAFAQSNNDAIRITGNSGTAEIGGFDDPSLVNLIAGASNNGIYLDNIAGHNVVGNNVIGFQPDGIGNGANGGLGIYDFGSPANSIAYNYIGNNTVGGIDLFGGNATGNLLEFNSIGLGRLNGPAGNGSTGIFLAFGANNNTIGASATSSYGGNTVAENQGPGVWLDSSAGTGNRILANSIFANSGLAIDLDARGATANDAGDGDTGANNLQNYPVLTSAQELLTSYLMTGTLDSNPSTTFRLDFYHDACSPLGVPARGNMYEPVGFATVTTDVGGHASFSLPIAHTPNVVLRSVAATATDPSGNTSEIGECVAETPFDQIFKNGFE